MIALHAAGFKHAAGSMGTALSAEVLAKQAAALRLVLCLDADAAGQAAMEKLCAEELFAVGGDVRIAALPGQAKDPAELLESDPAAGVERFEKAVAAAEPWSEWYARRILKAHPPVDPIGFSKAFSALAELMARLSAADRTFHAFRFAQMMAVEANAPLSYQQRLEQNLLNESTDRAIARRGAKFKSSPSMTAGGAPSQQYNQPTPTKILSTPRPEFAGALQGASWAPLPDRDGRMSQLKGAVLPQAPQDFVGKF